MPRRQANPLEKQPTAASSQSIGHRGAIANDRPPSSGTPDGLQRVNREEPSRQSEEKRRSSRLVRKTRLVSRMSKFGSHTNVTAITSSLNAGNRAGPSSSK
jgi:hypothetical protein